MLYTIWLFETRFRTIILLSYVMRHNDAIVTHIKMYICVHASVCVCVYIFIIFIIVDSDCKMVLLCFELPQNCWKVCVANSNSSHHFADDDNGNDDTYFCMSRSSFTIDK